MRNTTLLLILLFFIGKPSAQQIISNAEDIGTNWYPVGTTCCVDSWDNPLKDAVNGTNKSLTVWINNDAYPWTGAGLTGLNIDVKTYNTISVMVYKQIAGDVQLELKDDVNPNAYLHKQYTTPGHWQKLDYEIPEIMGNIKTIGVSPHFENYVTNPIPEGEAHRFWWDEAVAYYNPNAVSALYTKETLATSFGDNLIYRKLTPPTIEAGKKYPLVIFLHGAGERGNNNINQLIIGADLFAKNRTEYPAYVLFPQCPTQYFWPFDNNWPSSLDASTFPVTYPISHMIQQVKELVDTYKQRSDVDPNRIYVVGLSMGGMGTFDLVTRFPDVFAAAVPMCGGINVQRLTGNVKNVYWRIFHGDADDVVPVQNSRTANTALVQSGASVEYIELPGVKHNAWDFALTRADFLPWLFSKTKQQPAGIGNVKSNSIEKVSVNKKQLYIEANVSGFMSVKIYSMSGNTLYTFRENNVSGIVKKQYDLSAVSNGVYLVEVTDKKGNCSAKITI